LISFPSNTLRVYIYTYIMTFFLDAYKHNIDEKSISFSLSLSRKNNDPITNALNRRFIFVSRKDPHTWPW
jgi:hypothetical protein